METKFVVAILVIGILVIGGYLVYTSGPVVSADGTSSLKVQPDVVSVYLSIQTNGTTAQEAQNKNKEISDNVLTNLVRIGFDRKDIQLSSYNIYPDYNWDSGNQKQNGYIANQQLVVKISNFTKISETVDESVNAGALVSTINFELSDALQNKYKAEALQNASVDAREKASATAAGLGKHLGGLVSVQSQDFHYPGPVMYYASSGAGMSSDSVSAKRAAMNIYPQDIEVNADVKVEYRLSLF